ncbi:cell wall-binding repeat-containing protein [Egibacter rhizosphaerae]|uniref:Cell wall-binding repeat-containing protein n=1 Tax=Egibacter rhizosphaerae TaxID=1670831 RepID=A0A411YHZ5_9ACTN|nr:cell wall-binding repeat-containing protein [Egibacter rhizosphaerae]QBI20739.1 cell wall-binding repeat-containing protein [Egibacter rhizosphaerae]
MLAALALVASVVVYAPPAAADEHEPETQRIEGDDRFETAAEASQETYDDADDVIIAAGFNFPDALASGGLSGAVDAPILLVNDVLDSATDDTLDELDRLDPSTVHVAGGESAVSASIEAELEGDWDIERFDGEDRFETAAQMAGEFDSDDVDTAVVATGRVAADSLSVGPLAQGNGYPILLTEVNDLPDFSADALENLDVDDVLVLGGGSAVSDEVVEQIEDITGDDSVERLDGDTRFETAIEIAQYDDDFADSSEVLVATGFGPENPDGDNVPADALAAAPYGGENTSPLLPINDIRDELPDAIEDYASDNAAQIDLITIFGGTAAVSANVESAIQSAATTEVTPAVGFVDGPELQSVDLVSEVGSTARVAFEFDEDVVAGDANIDEEGFYLHDAFGESEEGDAAARADDNNVVNVDFQNLNLDLDDVTAGTVEYGTVSTAAGDANPEGSAGYQDLEFDGLADLPNLMDVGDIDENDADNLEVEFVFDEDIDTDAGNLGEDGFNAVYVDDDDETASQSGEGVVDVDDEVVTVEFDLDDDDDEIRRINIDHGTALASGADSVLQSVDVANGGSTTYPDLEDVEVNGDVVTYEFSETVLADDEADAFAVYAVNGNTLEVDSDEGDAVDYDGSTVEVDFSEEYEDGVLAEGVIGATVADEAVAADTAAGEENFAGEVRFDIGLDAGESFAPVLTEASIEEFTDIDGDLESVEVTYTFDKDVDVADVGSFRIYDESVEFADDGSEDEVDGNEVVVEFEIDDGDGDLDDLDDPVLATVLSGAVDNDDSIDWFIEESNFEGAAGF